MSAGGRASAGTAAVLHSPRGLYPRVAMQHLAHRGARGAGWAALLLPDLLSQSSSSCSRPVTSSFRGRFRHPWDMMFVTRWLFFCVGGQHGDVPESGFLWHCGRGGQHEGGNTTRADSLLSAFCIPSVYLAASPLRRLPTAQLHAPCVRPAG